MKFGMIVLQVNTHRLTESDFQFDVILSRWRPWHHFAQKSAAIWWMYRLSLQQVSIVVHFVLQKLACVRWNHVNL